MQGTVETRRTADGPWQAVKLNDAFCPGDAIRVQERSRADIALLNSSVLRLNANSSLTVEAPKEQRTGVIDLVRGAAHFFARGPQSLEVKTPYTIAGVRGTEFLIDVESDKALLTVFEGTVLAQSPAGQLNLTGGQSAVAEAGKAPALRVVARPRDAVIWALYYPPVVYFRGDQFQGSANDQAMVRSSLDAYAKGDIQRAFDALKGLPAEVQDPRLLAYRAHLLLTVGQADQAKADIDRALQLQPNNADALALQSIVQIVQNDKDAALATAQRAVQADPKSATGQIALSYAQQARFDLEGARTSLERAVALEPQNALAWARLAEIQSSFGELDKVQESAQKAASLAPDLSRTQTVLGFAHLTRIETGPARQAFEKAIALDSADPLPRLGLGLAKVRDGMLDEGGRDLEVAASLDPNNALTRSYLGKVYYEEKLEDRAGREYGVAKTLDPRDPTPWFYDAILKQTTNRPVEALQDLEKARELNSGRAVYRSQLLLDSDDAARAAGQARIFSDLGFQQRALVEGWESVNRDPTNFSAHRFLADSYSALPRHEIARVSELLQSQLLQPLNLTPLQPRLSESNLFLISAGGPGALSFNEFNPIFSRNGNTFQFSGLGGNNGLGAGEAVVAGLHGNFSYSVGYTHFQTDGWRTNADQKDDIANAFVQMALSPQTSVQAEYRYRKSEYGDLLLRFHPEDYFPGQRNDEERHFVRLGARHDFTPTSIFLVSATYQTADSHQRDEQFPQAGVRFTDFKNPDEDSIGLEFQYLHRASTWNLRAGGGYASIDGGIDQTIGLGPPLVPPNFPPNFVVQGTTPTEIDHYNVYAYADINAVKDLLVTLGASYDSLAGNFPGDNTNQFNPKVGVMWTPLAGTTVRAAAFRTLKRTLISQQTLEPTQVAGFNQFFDDFNLTDAWRYGAAVDQKFSSSLFGGVEISRRDLTVPFLDRTVNPANPPTREADWDETLARTYVLWTPHPWLGLKAEYSYERLKRDALPSGVREAKTHRLPLGVNFYHPSGLGASATATYYKQSGEFGGITAATPIRPGSDRFWVVDAGVNYRLPQRYGVVTVGVANLFDEDFRYYENDLRNASIQPTRTVFARVTLAFP